MKILILAITLSFTLSGCALTEYLSNYLNDSIDTNNHIEARDIDRAICYSKILERLKSTRTTEWYKLTLEECRSREVSTPLAN